MRSITEGNLLLSRLFNAAPSAAPLPVVPPTPATPPTVATPPPAVAAPFDTGDSIPFTVLPAGTYQTGPVKRVIFDGPITAASLPGWEDALKVIESGDTTAIVNLILSVSPAMAALVMSHIQALPAIYKGGIVHRLVLAASNDILQDPDDEPPAELGDEEE